MGFEAPLWIQICKDPCSNTDAGTMSPFEHREVYIFDNGGEVFVFDLVACLWKQTKLSSPKCYILGSTASDLLAKLFISYFFFNFLKG
ncbi:CTP synthetase [Olea europaea subsp. europaea]|uniref:CTP synthetase n=1 Tax=Olea europaea subsp. europaea TaxID=158383 RepID=A0A8S0UP83_OLEEU|nr:CTP synthetase [Olea europaea subsp. europaea]